MTRGVRGTLSFLSKGFFISLCLALVGSPFVYATSVYDDAYQTTSSLKINWKQDNHCSSDIDITSDWKSYILDSAKWDTPFATGMSAVKASFQQALATGRVGVTQIVANPGAYNEYKNVLIYWSEDDSLELKWNLEAGAVYAWSDINYNYASITCQATMSLGGHDGVFVTGWNIGDSPGYSRISAEPGNYPFSYYENFFVNTDYPNYPSGYDGESVELGEVIEPITGRVTCTNDANIISKVSINAQNGADGEAMIVDDGYGGKYYSYYLSENSPYQVLVLCDGDLFVGPTVTSPLYYDYQWQCVHEGDLPICAAS